MFCRISNPGTSRYEEPQPNEGIRWESRWINIGTALSNEFIALEPV